MKCGERRVIILDRNGTMWESKTSLEKVMKKHNWKKGGIVREGDIVIILGNEKRILREGIDPEIEKLMENDVKIIGVCWGYEYLAWRSGGEIVEGKLKKGIRDSKKWYNHYDSVSKLGKEWRGPRKRGKWINGSTRKWKGFQYHPEHNKESMKEMLKTIEKWKGEERDSCKIVIKKLKSRGDV
jgi:GMP synthase-like glutamine amidotransferase